MRISVCPRTYLIKRFLLLLSYRKTWGSTVMTLSPRYPPIHCMWGASLVRRYLLKFSPSDPATAYAGRSACVNLSGLTCMNLSVMMNYPAQCVHDCTYLSPFALMPIIPWCTHLNSRESEVQITSIIFSLVFVHDYVLCIYTCAKSVITVVAKGQKLRLLIKMLIYEPSTYHPSSTNIPLLPVLAYRSFQYKHTIPSSTNIPPLSVLAYHPFQY
jgi:hypothetical protein